GDFRPPRRGRSRRRSCFDSAVAVGAQTELLPRVHAGEADWLERCLVALNVAGCAVVEGVLGAELIERARAAMYRVRESIHGEIGVERLDRAGELGVLRLTLKYDPLFFEFLELPEVLALVDATVSNTAILHVQNGLLLPSFEGGTPQVFQTRFHRD